MSRYYCTQNVSGIRTIHCLGLGIFLRLWKSVKWPKIQACKKLSFPVHRGIFCCYLDSTHIIAFFFCQKYRRHLVGLGDDMHSHMDHFLAYFGVSIASYTPSSNCCSDLTPFSHRFLLFFGVFYSCIFFLINWMFSTTW